MQLRESALTPFRETSILAYINAIYFKFITFGIIIKQSETLARVVH
jgi:hypothetical protein